MDILSKKYEDLGAKEADIRMELSKAREKTKRPTGEVLLWLENAKRIKDHLRTEIQKLTGPETKNTRRFSIFYCMNKHSEPWMKLIKKTDRLLEISRFPNGLVVPDELVIEAPVFFGNSVQRTSNKIWGYMMDPSVRTISIYGTGGVGKTTIMSNMKSMLAATNTFAKILWVTVSEYTSLDNVRTDMALQLNIDLSMYEDEHSRAAKLFERLEKISNFLIVFDDVWKLIPFEEVKIPQHNCKIVLITRSVQVCYDMDADRTIRIGGLSMEESWDLFLRKAGNEVLTPEILPFAQKVVRECRGLPLVIISVGHAMRNEVSVEVWRITFESLKSSRTQGRGDVVFKLLRFSYNRLKDDMVKNCLLYCAFFPKDYLFKPEQLVRYWMAERFIHVDGDLVAEIDKGTKILRELEDANMLEKLGKGGDECLKMHALFRDMAIDIIKELRPGFLVQAGLGLLQLSLGSEWVEVEKVSVIRNKIEWLAFAPTDCPNISTLLFCDNPITHIASSFFCPLLALKFLDLSFSSIPELPPSLSELGQLRVLFLHYCTSLKKIPSLEKMRELQVLNLCGTLVSELPQGMEELVSLRSLDLSETTKLENIRVGLISSLSSLEELRMQGSGLCKMDSAVVVNYLEEMRSLKGLAILTLSLVNYEDHLDTIMFLQEQSLKIFSINMYGSTDDYVEDVGTL